MTGQARRPRFLDDVAIGLIIAGLLGIGLSSWWAQSVVAALISIGALIAGFSLGGWCLSTRRARDGEPR